MNPWSFVKKMNKELKKMIDEDIENSFLIKLEDFIRDYIVSLDSELDDEEYVEVYEYVMEHVRRYL